MKKNLTLLTGIVLVITILAAINCSNGGTRAPKVVKIKLKAVESNGAMHLQMYDSNNPGNKVIDTLETLVNPGDSVIWKLKLISGIEKIEKISPKTAGKIIDKDAENIPETKKFGLKIPDNAPIPSKREKYDIAFKAKNDTTTWIIDPYLRIPDEE